MKFTYNSPSSVNILGYDEKESRELTPEKIVTKESLDHVMHMLAEELARDGQPGVDPDRTIKLELEQIHKNGSHRLDRGQYEAPSKRIRQRWSASWACRGT